MKFYINKQDDFLLVLIFFLPAFVVTGPFLPDLIISILSLFFIFYFIKKKITYEFLLNFRFLFLFWFLIILSSFFSYDIKNSLMESSLLFRFVFFIIIFYYLFNTNILSNFFFYTVLTIILLISLDAYIQLFTEKNTLGLIKEDPKRLSGLFGDEYILGSYLLKFSPLIFFLAPENKKINNILIIIFLIIIEPLIFFAGQRSQLIMSVCMILGLFLINLKNKLFYVSLIISILIIFFNLNFNQKYHERYISDVKANFSYVNKIQSNNNNITEKKFNFSIISPPHTQIYYNSYLLFRDKPYFGHGIKSYRETCKNFNEKGCSTHPHNFYLQLLAETGFFVFLFLLIFYIKLIKDFYKIFIKSLTNKKNINKKYFSCLNLLIILFPLQTNGNFFNNYMLIHLAFALSLYLISNKKYA